MKCLFLTLIVSSTLSLAASAAPFLHPVEGRDAEMLFLVASDPGEPDAPGPVELSAGCHYYEEKGFKLQMCDSEIGFINSPVREVLSRILLANRTPKLVDAEEGRFAIGVHFKCVKSPAYRCELEDLD